MKSFSKRSAFYALDGLVDKIGDIKVRNLFTIANLTLTHRHLISLQIWLLVSLKEVPYSQTRSNVPVPNELMNSFTEK